MSLSLKEGPKAALAALDETLPIPLIRSFCAIKPGEGRPVLRTDVESDERISFSSFDPPWDWPYSVLFVEFRARKGKSDSYMHHSGEELLVPVSGEVQYEFFSSQGREQPEPERVEVKVGSVIRINPFMPHVTTTAGTTPAKAWMIFRDEREKAAAIAFESAASTPQKLQVSPLTPRRISRKKVNELGPYGLVTWGIAERIRLERERRRCRIDEVAAACNLDSSYVSRIEAGDANVSLESLGRITWFLHVPLRELISATLWDYLRDSFPRSQRTDSENRERRLCEGPQRKHRLHLQFWTLSNKSKEKSFVQHRIGGSSWILLEGQVIFELINKKPKETTEHEQELLGPGSVIHFSEKDTVISMHALEDARLIRVTYAERCPSVPRP